MAFCDEGILIGTGKIQRLKGKAIRTQFVPSPLPLTNEATFSKIALIPFKNYCTAGTCPPQSSNSSTFKHAYKVYNAHMDITGEIPIPLEYDNTKSNVQKDNPAMPGFMASVLPAVLTHVGYKTKRCEKHFVERMSQPYTVLCKGNMTVDFETLVTVNASQALDNILTCLQRNNCSPLGSTVSALYDAYKIFMNMPAVMIRRYIGKEKIPEWYEITSETLYRHMRTHVPFNKDDERGGLEYRMVACCTIGQKTELYVVESGAEGILDHFKGQVITRGGRWKNKIVADTIFDEELITYKWVLAGSEDKSGWNHKIQAAMARIMWSVSASEWSEENRSKMLDACCCLYDKWFKLSKIRVYSNEGKGNNYQDKYFDEIPWDELPKHWVDIFHGNRNFYQFMQRDFKKNRKGEYIFVCIPMPDHMAMGFTGLNSTKQRGVGVELTKMLIPRLHDLHKEAHGCASKLPRLKICYSSDDSTTVIAGDCKEEIIEVQCLQACIDSNLQMNISPPKTTYTMDESINPPKMEFTTEFLQSARTITPAHKALTAVKLSNGSMLTEIGNLCSAPARIFEEAGPLLAYSSVRTILNQMDIVNRLSTDHGRENPRREFLIEKGLYGKGPLFGGLPQLDPLTAAADTLYNAALTDMPLELLQVLTSNFGQPNQEVLPVKWGAIEERRMDFNKLYGGVPAGTMTFVKNTNKTNVNAKKEMKYLATDFCNAVCIINPKLANDQHSMAVPAYSMIVSLQYARDNLTENPLLKQRIEETLHILNSYKKEVFEVDNTTEIGADMNVDS